MGTNGDTIILTDYELVQIEQALGFVINTRSPQKHTQQANEIRDLVNKGDYSTAISHLHQLSTETIAHLEHGIDGSGSFKSGINTAYTMTAGIALDTAKNLARKYGIELNTTPQAETAVQAAHDSVTGKAELDKETESITEASPTPMEEDQDIDIEIDLVPATLSQNEIETVQYFAWTIYDDVYGPDDAHDLPIEIQRLLQQEEPSTEAHHLALDYLSELHGQWVEKLADLQGAETAPHDIDERLAGANHIGERIDFFKSQLPPEAMTEAPTIQQPQMSAISLPEDPETPQFPNNAFTKH